MDIIPDGSEIILRASNLHPKSIPLKSPVDGLFQTSQDETPRRSPRIRKMYWAGLSALLMAVAMGIATGYSAPATYDMTSRANSPIKPSKDQITWIGSALAIGALTGGLLGGPIADKAGRKTTLLLNIIPFITGWLSICFAKHIAAVIVGRLLCGVACGVISVAVPMYCVEISTSEVRGLLGSSFQGFIVIGNLMSVVIGSFITWEYLALTGASVATFGLVCFSLMPESPRWLVAQGKQNDAVKVMLDLQGNYLDAEVECEKIHDDLKSQPKGLLTLNECKHPSVYKPGAIAVILMFFQQFSGANAILFYSSSIFEKSKHFMDPKKCTIMLGVVQVVTTLLSNFIVDKAGRKLLLFLSGALMSVSLIFLGIYYYLASKDNAFEMDYNWIPLGSLVTFIIAFSLGYGAIPWLMAAEMVPLRARSTIAGLATFANGLSAFIVTKTFSDLEELIHTFGTFWTYSVMSIAGCLFIVLVVPETKGKELEDITKYFCKSQEEHSDSLPK